MRQRSYQDITILLFSNSIKSFHLPICLASNINFGHKMCTCCLINPTRWGCHTDNIMTVIHLTSNYNQSVIMLWLIRRKLKEANWNSKSAVTYLRLQTPPIVSRNFTHCGDVMIHSTKYLPLGLQINLDFNYDLYRCVLFPIVTL